MFPNWSNFREQKSCAFGARCHTHCQDRFYRGEIAWRRRREGGWIMTMTSGSDRKITSPHTHMCLARSAMEVTFFILNSEMERVSDTRHVSSALRIQKYKKKTNESSKQLKYKYKILHTGTKLVSSATNILRTMSRLQLGRFTNSDSKFTDRTSFTRVAAGQMQKRFQ